jgi:signal transduction histidine kinase
MNGKVDPAESAPPVLIVDDDARNLLALEAVLEPLHCRVVRAASGQGAVERTRVDDFAAIIMDVCMPGLDGFAAASFIRQDSRSSRTPILFVTARDDLDLAELTRTYGNTGHVDHLNKPFDPDVLRAKVRCWLELFCRGAQVLELERAMHSFETQARTKDDAIAMVAHDLKGPLCAMRLNMDRLRHSTVDGAGEPEYLAGVRRYVDRAVRNIDRMTTLVDDLLDNARIESGTLRLAPLPHPFEAIVSQSVELLQPLADQKRVEVVTGSDDVGVVVCDRDRILQVLSNLIGNAVKFTPPDGRVELEVVGSADAVAVCIRDSGPGISAEELPRLFQKYWQSNRHAHQKGVGLGLAIAKGIVLAHQGRIWAESQVGEGSRFFFTIPRVQAAVSNATAGTSSPLVSPIESARLPLDPTAQNSPDD